LLPPTALRTHSYLSLTERDKIKMSECFRLGDIVKAKVVSFPELVGSC
jgi:exosome complex RNA-binding protein Csl4